MKKTISSVEIANMFHRAHKVVKRDINKMLKEQKSIIGNVRLERVKYIDDKGKNQIMYMLTKELALRLSGVYNQEIRMTIIKATR